MTDNASTNNKDFTFYDTVPPGTPTNFPWEEFHASASVSSTTKPPDFLSEAISSRIMKILRDHMTAQEFAKWTSSLEEENVHWLIPALFDENLWSNTWIYSVKNDILRKNLNQLIQIHPVDNDYPINQFTDASDVAMAGILVQFIENKACVIGTLSRSYRDYERRYEIAKNEVCAIVHAVKHFKYILKYRKFTIYTDSKVASACLELHNYKTKTYEEWKNHLITYNYDIVHIPGERNWIADLISRQAIVMMTQHLKVPLEIVAYIKQQHSLHHGNHEQLRAEVEAKFGPVPNVSIICRYVADDCWECMMINAHKRGFSPAGHIVASRPFEAVAIDTIGPIKHPQVNKTKEYSYALVIKANSRNIEMCSREGWDKRHQPYPRASQG